MNTINWKNIEFVYFLGIGGIGMSALARYFLAEGKQVAGYDRTSTPLTDALREEGMEVHFQDEIHRIPAFVRDPANKEKTVVVLTPAIPAGHQELEYFRSNGYAVLKRSQVLGLLTGNHTTFGVAGTHGKTTTSSMLAFILHTAQRNCTAFLGGISVNFRSNLLLGDPSAPQHEIVVEADEFDRSFLTLFPQAAIITSMDADHLDIYGDRDEMLSTYRAFAAQVHPSGFILYKHGLPIGSTRARQLTYSITEKAADYRGTNITVKDGRYTFSLHTPGYVIDDLTLGLPGRHNVENAVAAAGLALETGVDPLSVKDALEQYAGVQRRFEYQVRRPDVIYIDDYAHHPEELRSAILSARELHPGKRITVAFQPHLFTRTRDFAEGFAESLSLADTVYLLDIYPARELPIPGVDSRMLSDKMTIADKHLVTKEEIIAKLRTTRPQVFMTLGAGDIDQLVAPVKKLLENA